MHRSLSSVLALTLSLLHAFACTVCVTKRRHLNGRSGEELLKLWRERDGVGESSSKLKLKLNLNLNLNLINPMHLDIRGDLAASEVGKRII
jgi:hypothetical protein